MKRPNLVVVHRTEITSACIPLSEKLADHHAILQGYLDTHVTRNHSKRTIDSEQQFLKGWFEGFMVQDDQHPDGERSLMIWEAMTPVLGRQRIIEFSKGLITSEFKPRTVNTYLGKLRRLFQYVLDNPYIPGNEVQLIITKYGRIEQPVKEYDYPVHILDPEDEGFVLTGKQLTQFYDFIRKEYISHNPKKLTASRDYTMIVLAGESGLRANEILNLDALKPHRDIFYEHNCIQTRHGKGVKGSGKRIRKTIFTPLAQATLHVYEEQIRPNFPNAEPLEAFVLYLIIFHALSVWELQHAEIPTVLSLQKSIIPLSLPDAYYIIVPRPKPSRGSRTPGRPSTHLDFPEIASSWAQREIVYPKPFETVSRFEF
ncbi:Site-specific recombinase XerD [Nostoc flagelliforme CCNUN1]|uniref:Site-specific recombinase XerD n=1 Tax=Nostoc flagelliforme CCNUN1 TaxID=2038116 RepID=A0A2K8T463_9NOSO|nr:site-specific integrase [Nostoc flagelliforme]AUB42508.1 Site-specific recombinase XerD [Nostoc flagelliforme CCNUN1]